MTEFNWDLEFSKPVAVYQFPPAREEEMTEEAHPQSEMDIRIALATQKTQIAGLTQTVEREFTRMADALGKHADSVSTAVNEMKNTFVTKAVHEALMGQANERIAKLERINAIIMTAVGLAVLGAILAAIGLGR